MQASITQTIRNNSFRGINHRTRKIVIEQGKKQMPKTKRNAENKNDDDRKCEHIERYVAAVATATAEETTATQSKR